MLADNFFDSVNGEGGFIFVEVADFDNPRLTKGIVATDRHINNITDRSACNCLEIELCRG